MRGCEDQTAGVGVEERNASERHGRVARPVPERKAGNDGNPEIAEAIAKNILDRLLTCARRIAPYEVADGDGANRFEDARKPKVRKHPVHAIGRLGDVFDEKNHPVIPIEKGCADEGCEDREAAANQTP